MTVTYPDWLAQLVAGARTGRLPAAILRWEHPPYPGNYDDDTAPPPGPQHAAELRAQPYRWGIVWSGSTARACAYAAQIRNGQRGFHYSGTFQATTRTTAGSTVVYCRYVAAPADVHVGGEL